MRLLEIGKIVKTRGLKGTLKVASFLERNDALLLVDTVFVAAVVVPRASQGKSITYGLVELPNGSTTTYNIKKVYPQQGNCFFIDITGIDAIEKAERLLGLSMFIPPEKLKKTDDDEYYWFELLGMQVALEDGTPLGSITSIFTAGSSDIFVCHTSDDKELLLPAIPDCILSVDTEQRIMVVRLLEEL